MESIYFSFFNATATTEIYTYGHTLSLHDALPIYHEPVTPRHAKPTKSHKKDQCLHRYETTSMPPRWQRHGTRALEMRDYRFKNAVAVRGGHKQFQIGWPDEYRPDRKSTRLNSSH